MRPVGIGFVGSVYCKHSAIKQADSLGPCLELLYEDASPLYQLHTDLWPTIRVLFRAMRAASAEDLDFRRASKNLYQKRGFL